MSIDRIAYGDLRFDCICPVAGYCQAFRRQMPDALWKICRGDSTTIEKRIIYRRTWARMALNAPLTGIMVSAGGAIQSRESPVPKRPSCFHLGERVGAAKCEFCKSRHKMIPIHACPIWEKCSELPYKAGQSEQDCKSCQQYTQYDPTKPPPSASSSGYSSSNN